MLPGAAKYDVRKLRFEWGGDGTAILELDLSTHTDYAVLRFDGVEDLHIQSDEVPTDIRVQIQDTSTCTSGSACLPSVRFGGVEGGKLSFWAATVERIPNET